LHPGPHRKSFTKPDIEPALQRRAAASPKRTLAMERSISAGPMTALRTKCAFAADARVAAFGILCFDLCNDHTVGNDERSLFAHEIEFQFHQKVLIAQSVKNFDQFDEIHRC
jgi:hypothetical protein